MDEGNQQKSEKEVKSANVAIVSFSKCNLSYLKMSNTLKILGNASRIRKTQKGDVILELKRSSVGKTDGVCTQVKNLLVENATIRVQKHKIYIQCKDPDEMSSIREMCTTFKKHCKLKEGR